MTRQAAFEHEPHKGMNQLPHKGVLMNELFRGEQMVCCHDRDTGLRAVIAVDDTRLGPAVGGVRMKAYPSELAAITEAQRLAAGMTLKNAAAGLPFGGGKSVILADDALRTQDRTQVLRAFGRFVGRLGGSYIPGVDMGTTVGDLAVVGTVAPRVACAESDPSPWTALGVHTGIRAAIAHLGGSDLHGVRVAIQGAGHVGAELARLLAVDGAHVIVADVDPARAQLVAARTGGEAVAADRITSAGCDVFAPCAVAKVVDTTTAGSLGCRVLAGAANDQLADRQTAAALADAGVLYVPDFLINAGGVVQIYASMQGWDDDRLRPEVLAIGDRVAAVLDSARHDSVSPLLAAEALASRRLTESQAVPA